MTNFPFGTNVKSIILGVPILKHITVSIINTSTMHLHLSIVNKVVTKLYQKLVHDFFVCLWLCHLVLRSQRGGGGGGGGGHLF